MNGTEDVPDEMSEEEDQAGVILGLHNVAVTPRLPNPSSMF